MHFTNSWKLWAPHKLHKLCVALGQLSGGVPEGSRTFQNSCGCHLAVGQKPMGSHFGVGEFTTHFRTYFSGWIGMFTGGRIWILTHGHLGSFLSKLRRTSTGFTVTAARCTTKSSASTRNGTSNTRADAGQRRGLGGWFLREEGMLRHLGVCMFGLLHVFFCFQGSLSRF